MLLRGVPLSAWHPFESRWPTERVARFQPQGDRFYALGDLPGKAEFDAAQEALDRDMGTPDKLRDWVLAAAKLYGIGELSDHCVDEALYQQVTSRIGSRPERLISAANRVLVESARVCADANQMYEVYPVFDRWAERFSERANRVPLWYN